jgi:hypothetical protein
LKRHNVQNEECEKDTPWVTRTGWKQLFKNKNMKELNGFTQLEIGQGENAFIGVEKVVQCIIEQAYKGTNVKNISNVGVLDCDKRGWHMLRFWLNSTKVGEPHTKPFRNQKKEVTMERYAKYWARLILFCLRTFNSEDGDIEFKSETRESLQNLYVALHLDD